MQILYRSGFFQPNPCFLENQSHIFWQAFRDALENTSRGPDGQRRILSIIAINFTYQELRSKLGVSIIYVYTFKILELNKNINLQVAANTVSRARQYARINGPGAPQV